MCRELLTPGPCWNFKCPHNLFWEELKLRTDRIHITKKALEISNCCCLINRPWTVEEIQAVWGLPRGEIRRYERVVRRKINGKNNWAQLN